MDLEQQPGESDEAYYLRLAAFISGDDVRTKTDLRGYKSCDFHLDREYELDRREHGKNKEWTSECTHQSESFANLSNIFVRLKRKPPHLATSTATTVTKQNLVAG